jgi:hypothetical protein
MIISRTGYFNEWAEKILVFLGLKKSVFSVPKGYARYLLYTSTFLTCFHSILKEIEYFWLRRMYGKLRDLFERPIASVPGLYSLSFLKHFNLTITHHFLQVQK